jgi:SAM-dependent methyltransferase
MTSHTDRAPAAVLRCRQCEQPFRFDALDNGYGFGHCACRQIPVAEDVLFADGDELQRRLTEVNQQGDREQARALVLGKHRHCVHRGGHAAADASFQRFVRHRFLGDVTARLHLLPLLRRLPRTRITKTLIAAAQWNPYMRYRFSAPSMLANVPLLGLLLKREGLVLDAPCGMGHLSFLLSKVTPPHRLVSMDLSPAFVYSARRFFVPGIAAAIVHDMSFPLPLGASEFGAVFCADAFHYVKDRVGLAREFMRLIRQDGVVVLAHAHNRLQTNAYAGYAMSPAEYAALFNGHPVRIFPESYVLDAYLDNAPLDLTRQFGPDDLASSPALVVIAAKSADAFQVIPPIRERLIDASTNPRPSELYRRHRRGDTIVFERHVPDGLRDDFAAYRQVLPQRVVIPESSLVRENGQERFLNYRELLANHVLVDVPERY